MTHDTPTITAQRRERTGTRYARRLRQTGRLPAVVYGHRVEPLHVSVDEKEMLHLMVHGVHVMHLDIEGGGTETCLVKDVQFGYLGDNVIHVDFARVNLEDEVTVHVRLDFVGIPEEAHHAGAILRHDHTELAVRCRVNLIPEAIRADLAKMDGLQFTAGEIELPGRVTLAEDPETIVASISFLKKQLAIGEEAEVEAVLEEPEVISEGKAEAPRADAKPEAESEEP